MKNNTALYLDHLVLYSEQPEALAKFYNDVLQMSTEKKDNFWLCKGKDRKIVIQKKGSNAPLSFTFCCLNEDELNARRLLIKANGGSIQQSTSPLLSGELDFSVQDPNGNNICFTNKSETTVESNNSLKGRLQHLAITSTDIEKTLNFYQNIIGFEISDRVENDKGNLGAVFLRGSDEHHCLAIFSAGTNRLDHHSYEAGDWELIKNWADHLSEHYIPLSWGPGRHGPGHNLFLMFNDPDGHWLEISAELERVNSERPIGVWEHCERTLNLWGKGMLRH
jgi:catechol 2,3-dioxygenase-like lactoylglutathione lyase family enzyme